MEVDRVQKGKGKDKSGKDKGKRWQVTRRLASSEKKKAKAASNQREKDKGGNSSGKRVDLCDLSRFPADSFYWFVGRSVDRSPLSVVPPGLRSELCGRLECL